MKGRFTLNEEFIQEYADRKPPFGFNGLGELVYLRTYSRIKEDGTNERWFETVRRVVEGCYSMQMRWIKSQGLRWNARKAQASAQEMYERIFTMKFLPPGRGLWAMGSALTEEREMFAALNNCAFVSTNNLREDRSDPFTFLMDASMLGIGVGFDTLGAGTLLVQEPCTVMNADGVIAPTIIPDTREGWVESLKALLDSYFSGMARVVFDYSAIRPAGAVIKGFGGVASGPDPLMKMHESIREVLNALIGKPITVTAIVDIMNIIGACVVAGNVRRTAEIAFGAADSIEFMDLKDYAKNPGREAWGWTSNNSIFAELGMDYTEAAKRVSINGEPGFAWLDNMRAYSRMGQPIDNKDYRVMGGNPCLEQSLESYELCCLVETYPHRHESLEDYLTTLKYAYLYGKTVTLGKTPWERTNEVMLRNRRIGLSQSGIQQFVAARGIAELIDWSHEGYHTVQYYDEVYSEWFKIPRSIKTTSIKPSGTISLLAGATPGMHWPEAKQYIRRMRLSIHSDLIEPLLAAGYTVEPCIGSEDSTVVVEVPVQIEEDVRTVAQVSMWEQLSMAAVLQEVWADNQVSCTVTFNPATEGGQIAHALDYFQYRLKGVSFLPRPDLFSDAKSPYAQMPYETITPERYTELAAQLRPVSFQGTHEAAEAEKFCSNDTCVIA